MAKKATRLMQEAIYRWSVWKAEGTPGELDRACRLVRQALAWAERQRQPVPIWRPRGVLVVSGAHGGGCPHRQPLVGGTTLEGRR